MGRLQGHYLGTRNGSVGIPKELFHRLPLIGLLSYAVAKTCPAVAEKARVALFPLFDQWVKSNLPERTGILSSYGYAVESFKKARKTGGVTMLDAGNSHPQNFWNLVEEEHKRWGVDVEPYPRKWNEGGKRSVELTDWVFSPSTYVTRSFIEQGFPEDRILYLPYPINLDHFNPEPILPIPESPLKVICTGSVSFRKGFPYLLEAMRILAKNQKVELLLTEGVQPSMQKLLNQYSDIPINWAPRLPHTKLGERLKSAHVFALLSLEDGFALTCAEAMSCGLPVVLTPNTGFADFIKPGINGEIVPIRDPQAAADAILSCYHRKIRSENFVDSELKQSLSFQAFSQKLIEHLKTIDQVSD